MPSDLWLPLPETTTAVVEGFRRFAVAVASEAHNGVLTDAHFMPQRRLLAASRMPYAKVYTFQQLSGDGPTRWNIQIQGGAPLQALPVHN